MKALKTITENNTVEIFKKHLEDFNNDKLDLKALKKDLDNLPFNTEDILKFIKMLRKELITVQRGEDYNQLFFDSREKAIEGIKNGIRMRLIWLINDDKEKINMKFIDKKVNKIEKTPIKTESDVLNVRKIFFKYLDIFLTEIKGGEIEDFLKEIKELKLSTEYENEILDYIADIQIDFIKYVEYQNKKVLEKDLKILENLESEMKYHKNALICEMEHWTNEINDLENIYISIEYWKKNIKNNQLGINTIKFLESEKLEILKLYKHLSDSTIKKLFY